MELGPSRIDKTRTTFCPGSREWHGMYNDRAQIREGSRAMAGLSADDTRAQTTGLVGWSSVVAHDKQRWNDKFIDPIPSQPPGRATQGGAIISSPEADHEPYSAANLLLMRTTRLASSPPPRMGVTAAMLTSAVLSAQTESEKPYYTEHWALDRTLLPQRMPIPGYRGHLRRTKDSNRCFGTSHWKPRAPPSRAAQTRAAYENARRLASEAQRSADFMDNDPFTGMDGKQGSRPIRKELEC